MCSSDLIIFLWGLARHEFPTATNLVIIMSSKMVGMAPQEAPDWVRNYSLMSILVGVNHGVEDMFFAYSTLVYPGNLGYDCNTLLYLVWCFSAMLVAAPVTAKVGSKAAILIGLVLYCLQYICFVTCSLLPYGWILRLVAYTGAIGAGLGAGFVWTAEGVFFAESTQRVVDVTGDSFEPKSAQLAAILGMWGLGLECAVKIATYALEALGFSITIVFSIALVLALGSALLFKFCIRPVHARQEK